jgi:hypothetical protein
MRAICTHIVGGGLVTESSHRVVSPAHLLPDGVDATDVDGIRVRKGSVGAFVANVRNLEALERDSAAYRDTVAALEGLVPALRAVGVFDVFEPREPWLRDLVGRS